jgi:tRNA pseudouridine55 synthase
MNGLLVLDKPPGVTSRDAVNVAQRWFLRGTKLGHTGTLDPLATGVLVLCVGQATRLAEYVQAMPKTYRSRFLLGSRSDTDDADGTVAPTGAQHVPTADEVRSALDGFLGEIDQIPPAYSAAKVSGARSYDLAREGRAAPLAARRVRVDAIRVLDYAWPHLEVEIDCGKGTYVRSIARDLGEKLGCGGLVATLRRLRVGPFEAGAGLGLDADATTARSRLLPMAAAVGGLPSVRLGADALERLQRGQAVAGGSFAAGTEVAVLDGAGVLRAVARAGGRGELRPEKVFA